MTKKLRLLLFITLFFVAIPMAAQVVPTLDSLPVQNDTVKQKREEMYKSIQEYSRKRKFTKFMHKLIFRPVREQEASGTRKKTKQNAPEMQSSFAKYNGKTIRKIKIVTLDPFGNSITDTLRKPSNWAERTGNSIHLKTKEMTIRNLLLFKEGKPLDSLLVEESERLIRAQRYTRRVIISAKPIEGNSEYVDVEIRVLDSWSLIPNGSASSSRTSFELTERNFFGLGHEFKNEFDKELKTGQSAYLGQYTVPNVMNTYTKLQATYQTNTDDSYLKRFSLQREFFSAYTRWAGGFMWEESLVRDSLPNSAGVYAMQNMKWEAKDFWGGYAFKIFKGFTEEDRTTNLVTTARLYNRQYKEKPFFQYDSVGYYGNEKLYMASIGLTSRKFVQDKFLFNYDIVEDIPIGRTYSFTGGMQDKNRQRRVYLGGRYAFGNYYKWGYMSINAEVGSFFYKDKTQETTLRFDLLYFTNMKQWGNWRFRHFIQPILVFGDNRAAIIKDQLNLSGDGGIPDFNGANPLGTKKFTLKLQTQSYAPWDVFGFRLNPFANFTMGVIGDEELNLYKSKVYTQFGIGLLITNDYLVFNSFQLSLAFYPTIPGNGDNIFKTNSFKNNDIMLPDFQIGEPKVVPYE
ncbi:hypothetical protein [Flavobacterium beibuense]|uniref:Outer membrane protein/protective antigen OMA87 n=1 Tax=Flavobacterium beibuense TaxID=657326 RepID=A0A444W7F8_9FLAO|nr:hypothetical protein [Flavobacterium beibuense]RYJ41790.1 hypothetical protein NU09_2715 [Flavobacterium beibuense]